MPIRRISRQVFRICQRCYRRQHPPAVSLQTDARIKPRAALADKRLRPPARTHRRASRKSFDPPLCLSAGRESGIMSAIVAIPRRAVHALLAFNSSGQLAAGFAIGMVIGLVPKGNLIALSLCVLLFSLRCNKGLAILAAALFSCVAPWTDPFAHKLGIAALSLQPLQSTYASVYNLPLGPWLGFNNTVVAGSLLLGLYGAYPVFYTCSQACAALRTKAVTHPASDPVEKQSGGAA
jgi:uncharacterized protein (TIGR03546 family)